MAMLKCRHCETEIDSNVRKTRCPNCGELFPFACAVCAAPLRPPFPVFDDERYLNDKGEPLCPEHFQRQCPKCESWFGAHENPGYFLCKSCMKANVLPKDEPIVMVAPEPQKEEAPAPPKASPEAIRRKNTSKIINDAITVIVFISVVAVVVILGWQIFIALYPGSH